MNQNNNIETLDEEKKEPVPEEQKLQEEHFEPKSKKEEKKIKKSKEQKLSEEIELLKKELAIQQEENKNAVEKIKLAQAELVNYRKRKDEETASILKYANKDIISELLSTVDNFERAISQAEQTASEEQNKFLSGFKIMYQNLKTTLNKFGVEEINRVGEIFDPNLEQALLTECVAEKDDEIVLEVLQKGYKLKDRVIRPASVKINQK